MQISMFSNLHILHKSCKNWYTIPLLQTKMISAKKAKKTKKIPRKITDLMPAVHGVAQPEYHKVRRVPFVANLCKSVPPPYLHTNTRRAYILLWRVQYTFTRVDNAVTLLNNIKWKHCPLVPSNIYLFLLLLYLWMPFLAFITFFSPFFFRFYAQSYTSVHSENKRTHTQSTKWFNLF